MPLRNLHIWFRYSWLCYHSNCQFYFPPLHIHCSASGLPFILIYSLVVSAWKRLNLIMNETALKVGPDCLLRVRRAIWTDLGSAIFFMPWWNHFENPQTPLVLPGNMGEAIGAWIDDSENEIFTVNYANYVFFCCRVSLKPANMPFCHRGNARGMQFHVSLLQCFETCFSLETGREQWHPTDWIYRYLSSNCSMETEPGPQTGCVLDVFWAIFWVGWRKKNHTLIGFKIGP